MVIKILSDRSEYVQVMQYIKLWCRYFVCVLNEMSGFFKNILQVSG